MTYILRKTDGSVYLIDKVYNIRVIGTNVVVEHELGEIEIYNSNTIESLTVRKKGSK